MLSTVFIFLRTPLHCAASCNNTVIAKLLVDNGACVFATALSDHQKPSEKCDPDEDDYDACLHFLQGESFVITLTIVIFVHYSSQCSFISVPIVLMPVLKWSLLCYGAVHVHLSVCRCVYASLRRVSQVPLTQSYKNMYTYSPGMDHTWIVFGVKRSGLVFFPSLI